DRGFLDVAVLEDLEEDVGERKPEDRHVELDSRVADELLDVPLVADPRGDELEAEEVAVERDGPVEVGDLDPEVVDAAEAARRRDAQGAADCTTPVGP